ncbi:MAG: hypothetical protein WCS37_01955 [Chloroflexota bacterium]|nr:hypothetical protein [Chloroflexota bacterium]
MKTKEKLLTRFQVQEYLGVDRIKIFVYLKEGKLHRFTPKQDSGSEVYRLGEVKSLATEKPDRTMATLPHKTSWMETTIPLTISVHNHSEKVWEKAGSGEGTYSLAKKLMRFDMQVEGELESVLTLLNTTTSQEEKELAICWLDRKGYGNKFVYQLLS